MKIRLGFVSNSSSSSFIVGIAEILDKTKFDAYVVENGIVLDDNGEVFITTTAQESYDIHKRGDKVVVDNFCTEVSTYLNKPGTMYFVVNISNNEGDTDFWNESRGDMDYDIDIGYFPDSQQEAYNAFSAPDSGLSMENDVTFGAARNG